MAVVVAAGPGGGGWASAGFRVFFWGAGSYQGEDPGEEVLGTGLLSAVELPIIVVVVVLPMASSSPRVLAMRSSKDGIQTSCNGR